MTLPFPTLIPVQNVLVFNDPVDKKLDALLKALFSMASSAMQLAVVAVSVFQALTVWSKYMARDPRSIWTFPSVLHQLELLHVALCCCLHGLADTFCLIPRVSLLLVHV